MNLSHKCDPKKPAAPVISTRCKVSTFCFNLKQANIKILFNKNVIYKLKR